MDPMTPNTAAFLNMLTAAQNTTDPKQYNNPTSLPPSAFWPMPIPGRDTPERSPESSIDAPKDVSRGYSVSDDSDHEKEGNHKRKAGRGSAAHTAALTQPRDDEEDEDDDSEGDSPSGHEGKRQHQNAKNIRGSRRKSGGDDSGKQGKDVNKAAKRKEQNRAAQKAFRERREARVKDLETKVAELEAKSFGATVENENLRGILKRLQEENVALKQSAFTFSVPLSGSGANPSPKPATAFSQPNIQNPKPPTPPHTVSNDSLRSVDEIHPGSHRPSMSSGNGNAESPDSLNSVGSGSSEYYAKDQFKQNALAGMTGIRGSNIGNSSNTNLNLGLNQGSGFGDQSNMGFGNGMNTTGSGSDIASFSPDALSTTNKSELDALWASFYPNGFPGVSPNTGKSPSPLPPAQNQQQAQNQHHNQNQNTAQNGNQFTSQPAPFASPFSFFNAPNDYMSYPDSSLIAPVGGNFTNNALGSISNDKMAFRDSNQGYRDANSGSYTNLPALNQQPPTQNGPIDNWADLTDNSVADFLASLTGGNNEPLNDMTFENDDLFNQQIQQMLAASASGLTEEGKNSVFSPTNYLNMSPSPLNSINSITSNSQSPSSINNSASNVGSPDSSLSGPSSSSHRSTSLNSKKDATSPPAAPAGAAAAPCGPTSGYNTVQILGPDGKIVRPSELWDTFGSKPEEAADALVIDDLCDQMRAKATCVDGKHTLTVDDVKMMMVNRPDFTPFTKDANGKLRMSVTEPEKCQHMANEAYMAIHGIKP